VNINRISEALRVIEDIARFYILDENLTLKVKNLRASFNLYRKSFEKGLLGYRESRTDMGRIILYDKNRRESIDDVLGSSFGRAQESCRVLEEFAKINNFSSEFFKEMRYSLYEFEKEAFIMLRKKRFNDDIGLYLIMTNPKVGYEKLAEIAVKAKIRVIQFRDKNKESRDLLLIAKSIRSIVKNSKTVFIVNDRIDIALMSEADGVHLGQTDIPVSEARKISRDLIIGKSTHNLIQLKSALKENPDYVGIGPIYSTNSKKIKDKVLGIQNAKRMLFSAKIPAVGIGGIKDYNLNEVLSIGFNNIAILSFISESENPGKEIERIQSILRRKNDIKR